MGARKEWVDEFAADLGFLIRTGPVGGLESAEGVDERRNRSRGVHPAKLSPASGAARVRA